MGFGRRERRLITIWLFTLLSLAIVFSIYSYVYVDGRRTYFTQKRIRNLRSIGDRFTRRVENIANNVVPNAVQASTDPANTEVPRCDNVRARPIRTSNQARGNETESCDLLKFSYFAKLVPQFSVKAITYSESKDPIPPHVDIDPRDSRLTFKFTGSLQHSQSQVINISGQVPVNALFGQYDRDSFDSLLVTDEAGTVFFQTGTDPAIVTSGSALFRSSPAPPKKGGDSNEAGDWSTATSSSVVRTVMLGGREYVLFAQPLDIALVDVDSSRPSSETQLSWRLLGLVEKSRLVKEGYAISYTTISVFAFLFLLLLTAWPFLKVLTLGPHDWLASRDVILLCVSSVITIALLTFFAIDLYTYFQLEQRADQQLETLANTITENFRNDIRSELSVARNLSKAEIPSSGTFRNIAKDDQGGDYGEIVRKGLASNAFVEMATWICPSGMQWHKGTIRDRNTRMISVAGREYFTRVRDDKMWHLTLSDSVPADQNFFALQPVTSWNTGETLNQLAVPGPQVREEKNKASACDKAGRSVISLDIDLPSLRDPVLPPGYGFVVIDADGSELYHSDGERHSSENFFIESDRDPEIRAAVLGRAATLVSGRYLGMDHRFYVTPLATRAGGPPWLLIVFREKLWLRTVNLESLSIALIMFAWLFLFLLPVFLVLWAKSTDWLWPDWSHPAIYQRYLLSVCAIGVGFSIGIFVLSRATLMYLSLIVPATILVMTYRKFHKRTEERLLWKLLLCALPALCAASWLLHEVSVEGHLGEAVLGTLLLTAFCASAFVPRHVSIQQVRKRSLSARLGYLLSFVVLLITIGVLPALALFRIAYENEMTLYLRHGQLRLNDALHRRQERLVEKYRSIGDGSNLLKKRLAVTSDIYQSFFFSCQSAGPPPDTEAIAQSESNIGYLLDFIRPLYNEAAIESHALFHNHAADDTHWFAENNVDTMTLGVNPLETSELHGFKSLPVTAVEVPKWWKPAETGWSVLPWLLVFVLLILAAFEITRFLARRIFLLDLKPAADAAAISPSLDFESIWNECQPDEKSVLYDLASDGFVNSRNPALPSILRKGLVLDSPLRMYDVRFGDFVKSKGGQEAIASVAKEDVSSVWRLLKWPLIVAMITAAVFLFFIQRNAFDTSIGLIGALVTGLTGVYKLMDVVRGNGRQP